MLTRLQQDGARLDSEIGGRGGGDRVGATSGSDKTEGGGGRDIRAIHDTHDTHDGQDIHSDRGGRSARPTVKSGKTSDHEWVPLNNREDAVLYDPSICSEANGRTRLLPGALFVSKMRFITMEVSVCVCMYVCVQYHPSYFHSHPITIP